MNSKYEKCAYPGAADARQGPDLVAAGRAPDLESEAYGQLEAGLIDHRRSPGHMRSFEEGEV